MSEFGIPIAPGWVMLILFAGASGAAFKVLRGRQARGLLACWVIAFVGFVAGEMVAENTAHLVPVRLPRLGDFHWLEATVIGWLLLFVFARSGRR